MSFHVSQAAESSFCFRLVPLFIRCTRTFVSSTDIPHTTGATRILASGRSYIAPFEEATATLPPSTRTVVSALSCCAACHPLVLQAAFHLQPFGYHEPPPSGGRARQHYRPDGSRRRTAGELAKRAARAAARAAADAAGGGAAKPAAAVAADASTQAVTPVPKQAPVSTPPTQGSCQPLPQLPPRPRLWPRPRQPHLDLSMAPYPGRMQHPPPSIAAGPKLDGDGQRTWMPTPKMKAPPPNLLPTFLRQNPAHPRRHPPRRGRQKQLPWQQTRQEARRRWSHKH